MKNDMSLCSTELNILQKRNDRFQRSFNHLTGIIKKSLFAFIAVFVFNTAIMAQTTASVGNMDVSYLIKKNRKELQQERQQKQQLRAVESIPQITMDKFSREFPKAENVEWSAPAGFIEADYTYRNIDRMAFYDWDNHLIGHGKYVSYEEIPASAQKYIAKHYNGYTPEKVMWYDDNEDNDLNLEMWSVPFDRDSYIVMIQKGDKREALQVSTDGDVSFFSEVK